MKLVAIVAAALSLPAPALCQDNKPPRYDVEKYCADVAASVGGSASIENSCIRREQEAYNGLKQNWGKLPAKAVQYCNDVASSVGGTYSILSSCIKRETEAAETKPGFDY